MSSHLSVLAILGSVAVSMAADEPFNFCRDNSCQDCPVSLTSAGTGYPECVIYHSDDVFGNQDPPFEGSDGGGWAPFFRVPQPDPTCQVIIKTPANTDVEGCGTPVGSFSSDVCATVSLEETFMVQFCCGIDDCNAAGASSVDRKRSGGSVGGAYLTYPNGTIIPPFTTGPMIVPSSSKMTTKVIRGSSAARRDSGCDSDSWIADEGMEDYTRPADGSEVVLTGITGGETVMITHERSVSATESLSAGLNIEDVLNIGVSFSITEEESDSTSRSFTAPDGQSGDVIFTPFLRCSTGTGTCNGGQLHGEICTGYTGGDGDVAGQYAVEVHS